MAPKQHYSAGDVEALLRAKHSEDVFVPECKTGQSGSGCRRLDAWVMKRSYSPFCCIGYEIKVSRQDFVNDAKLTEYLPYCHQFYLVAPDGLIKPDEIPPEAGLMRVTKNGKRLLTVKKAPFRQITVPDALFKYVIMSRTEIVSGTYNHIPRLEAYRQFVAGKADKTSVGHMASRKIAKHVSDMRTERDDALRSVADTQAAIKAFAAAGIDLSTLNKFNAERKAREIAAGVSDALLEQLERVSHDTARLAVHLRKQKGEA